ncbi:hypothetical protein GJ744_002616 [Endocarpon pusillum]|uniref:Uncharacterized protein n=1 Tax=Endocarpon pusillum TaxID=364733 RepID=A0A8H7AAK4_9EURO|nr:hypothetical protein GJ744_002616 [Endocarpon pusillum]
MKSQEIHITLNPLDYVPPRNYVRLLFPFVLKPGVDDKVVFNDLREALHKTFVQQPWLSGKLFRQAPTRRNGAQASSRSATVRTRQTDRDRTSSDTSGLRPTGRTPTLGTAASLVVFSPRKSSMRPGWRTWT